MTHKDYPWHDLLNGHFLDIVRQHDNIYILNNFDLWWDFLCKECTHWKAIRWILEMILEDDFRDGNFTDLGNFLVLVT